MTETTQAPATKPSKVTKLSLSAAIRFGGQTYKQCEGWTAGSNMRCALGAALEAVGHNVPSLMLMDEEGTTIFDGYQRLEGAVLEAWPELGEAASAAPLVLQPVDPGDDSMKPDMVLAPLAYWEKRKLQDIVETLNDSYGWTFEEIADYCESIGH